MMKKVLLLFLLPTIFLSCQEEKIKVPADILPQSRMCVILADLQVADASIQIRSLSANDSTKLIAAGYYRHIFQRQNISLAEFSKSFDWYVRHPDLYAAMYDDVISELSRRESEAKGK